MTRVPIRVYKLNSIIMQKNPFKFMSKCATFVLTSKWEGLPNVLIEAQQVGTPIISTNCNTGPKEILLNGKLGELIPVGNKSILVKKIEESAKPISDSNAIAQCGTIAAGNDEEVGEMIANSMEKVGKEGVISLEEGKSMTTELEVTEGMRFDKGYITPYFATDTERM